MGLGIRIKNGKEQSPETGLRIYINSYSIRRRQPSINGAQNQLCIWRKGGEKASTFTLHHVQKLTENEQDHRSKS